MKNATVKATTGVVAQRTTAVQTWHRLLSDLHFLFASKYFAMVAPGFQQLFTLRCFADKQRPVGGA